MLQDDKAVSASASDGAPADETRALGGDKRASDEEERGAKRAKTDGGNDH